MSIMQRVVVVTSERRLREEGVLVPSAPKHISIRLPAPLGAVDCSEDVRRKRVVMFTAGDQPSYIKLDIHVAKP